MRNYCKLVDDNGYCDLWTPMGSMTEQDQGMNEEMEKLRSLYTLIADLLLKNQQLRERLEVLEQRNKLE